MKNLIILLLNSIINYIFKFIYLSQLRYKNLIGYILSKEIYNNNQIKYYRTDKIILMNNANVALPSQPYHIVDQSP
jgi:hypothetical protein